MTEDERQYNEAKRFLELCPDFDAGNIDLCHMLVNDVEARGVAMTAEALASAWCQYSNQPDPFEPKVMTPEDFHKKVEAIDFKPMVSTEDIISLHNPLHQWTGTSTGIHGATTVTPPYQTTLTPDEFAAEFKFTPWNTLPDLIPEKVVAPMPTTWYSDIVDLQTERRIKDIE